MKLVLRQILKYTPNKDSKTERFYLLKMNNGKRVCFYKRSSFKLKQIRNYKIKDSRSDLYFS